MITIGGVVAPAVFTHAGTDEYRLRRRTTQAASVVGEVLRQFRLVSYGAGIVLGAYAR